MSELAYHRAPDALIPTNLRVLAKDLQVGDVITTPGLIPVTVTRLRDYPRASPRRRGLHLRCGLRGSDARRRVDGSCRAAH